MSLHFTKKCVELSRTSKLFMNMKQCIRLNLYRQRFLNFFLKSRVLTLCYLLLQDITGTVVIPDYLAAQQQNKVINFQNVVLTLVCFSAQIFCHSFAST